MACSCTPAPKKVSSKFKKALWIALILNLTLFIVEVMGGFIAQSSSLWVDALDFLGDSFNYAISLAVLGMGLYWRATVALWKGITMFGLGLFIIAKIASSYWFGIVPEPMVMGGIAILALGVNLTCAIILYAFKDGDSNMQSVWLCTRNDVIANIAIFAAAIGVFGTKAFWPDLIVACIMVILGVSAGYRVIKISLKERQTAQTVKYTQA